MPWVFCGRPTRRKGHQDRLCEWDIIRLQAEDISATFQCMTLSTVLQQSRDILHTTRIHLALLIPITPVCPRYSERTVTDAKWLHCVIKYCVFVLDCNNYFKGVTNSLWSCVWPKLPLVDKWLGGTFNTSCKMDRPIHERGPNFPKFRKPAA